MEWKEFHIKLKALFQCELIARYVCKPPQVDFCSQYWHELSSLLTEVLSNVHQTEKIQSNNYFRGALTRKVQTFSISV